MGRVDAGSRQALIPGSAQWVGERNTTAKVALCVVLAAAATALALLSPSTVSSLIGAPQKQAAASFALLDRNGDGLVTAEELPRWPPTGDLAAAASAQQAQNPSVAADQKWLFSLGAALEGAANFTGEAVTGLGGFVADAANVTGHFVGNVAEGAGGFVAGAANSTVHTVGDAAGAAAGGIADAANGTLHAVEGAPNAIGHAAAAAANATGSAMSGAAGAVGDFAAGAANATAGAVSSAVDTVGDFVGPPKWSDWINQVRVAHSGAGSTPRP